MNAVVIINAEGEQDHRLPHDRPGEASPGSVATIGCVHPEHHQERGELQLRRRRAASLVEATRSRPRDIRRREGKEFEISLLVSADEHRRLSDITYALGYTMTGFMRLAIDRLLNAPIMKAAPEMDDATLHKISQLIALGLLTFPKQESPPVEHDEVYA